MYVWWCIYAWWDAYDAWDAFRVFSLTFEGDFTCWGRYPALMKWIFMLPDMRTFDLFYFVKRPLCFKMRLPLYMAMRFWEEIAFSLRSYPWWNLLRISSFENLLLWKKVLKFIFEKLHFENNLEKHQSMIVICFHIMAKEKASGCITHKVDPNIPKDMAQG